MMKRNIRLKGRQRFKTTQDTLQEGARLTGVHRRLSETADRRKGQETPKSERRRTSSKMVSVTPAKAFLNLGKNHKTDSISKYCRKSRGTTHNTNPGDRQSYYDDCHILQDESRRIRGSVRKGCLSNGYGLPTRTLRRVGTAHNSIFRHW